MNRLLIALLLCISICTSAQTSFTPGYIVKTNGDSLQGYLQEEVRNQLVFQIQFKTDISNSAGQSFTPNDVKAFKYQAGDLFRAITFKNTLPESGNMETVFGLELVNGSYNLYCYIFKDQTYYIVEGRGSSYFLYNTVMSGTGLVITEGNYISRLSVLAASCTNRSFYTDRLNYADKELAKYIFDLNNCLSPETASINNYKALKTRTKIAFYAGGFPYGSQSQITLDAALRLITPQLSKSTSFNFALHFDRTVKTETTKYGIDTYKRLGTFTGFSVPITLQHDFLEGPVRPFIAMGIGAGVYQQDFTNDNLPFYAYYEPSTSQFKVSIIGAVGIEANIAQRLAVHVEWRYEYLLQFPSVGLALRL